MKFKGYLGEVERELIRLRGLRGFSRLRKFIGSWKGVVRELRRTWKGVKRELRGLRGFSRLRKLRKNWKGVERELRRSWEGLERKLRGSWEGIEKELRGIWEEVERELRGNWEGVKEELRGVKEKLKKSWERELSESCPAAALLHHHELTGMFQPNLDLSSFLYELKWLSKASLVEWPHLNNWA